MTLINWIFTDLIQNKRKSAKICENLRESAKSAGEKQPIPNFLTIY